MTSFFQTLQNETRSAQQSMLQAPVFAACANGDISLEMYQRFLTQAYHHVKHTVPLLMACGARLSDDYEWVRDAIAEYIDEEKGHQEWILNDIHASGGDAAAVRANRAQGRVGTPIELMVAYLYHQIDRHNPLAHLAEQTGDYSQYRFDFWLDRLPRLRHLLRCEIGLVAL